MLYCPKCGHALTELKSTKNNNTYVCTICGEVFHETPTGYSYGGNLCGSVNAKRYIDICRSMDNGE